MNQNILLLGVAGAAALYFMSQKKKQEEEDAEEEAEMQSLLSAKTAAEEAASAAQETLVAAQEKAEDEPAVAAQILQALEGAMDAVNLDLSTDPGLGMAYGIAHRPGVSHGFSSGSVGVAAELRAGTAQMHMERIGKRLYQVTITRPDGSIVAIKARVRKTIEGPKVILFGAGEHFRDVVKKRRAAISRKKDAIRRRRASAKRAARKFPVSPYDKKKREAAKKVDMAPPTPKTVTDDPVESPSGELKDIDLVMGMAVGLLPTAQKSLPAEATAQLEAEKPQLLALLRQVAEGARSGKYAANLKGLRFRRWVVLRLRRSPKPPGFSPEDQAAIEAELNALLDAEGFPAASGEDLSGLHSSIPNFGYLGWS